MASIVNIQTGTFSIGASAASDTVNVSSYTAANTLLMFSVRGGNNTTGGSMVSGQKASSTTLTFARADATGPVLTGEFTLVELDSNVDVQDVAYTASGTTAISAVTLAQTFVLGSGLATGGTTYGNDDNARVYMASSTLVGHARQAGTSTGYLQVVDWIGASVEQADVTLNNVTQSDDTITSVTTGETFAVSSMEIGANLLMNNVFTFQLFNSTTLRYNSYVALASDQIITTFVVELDSEWSVERGQQAFAATEGTQNVTIGAVDTDFAWSDISSATVHPSLARANIADDDFAESLMTQVFTTSTNLQLQRANTTAAANASWVVVENAQPVTCDQEGSRFRTDDGSESAATWYRDQDLDVSRPKLVTTRLRLLTDYTGNPATRALKLQFRKTGDPDSEWEDLA